MGLVLIEIEKSPYSNNLEDKRCYKKASLDPEYARSLIADGFHESQQWDIITRKIEAFLLKPRYNESDSHLFLVCRIADYLSKLTDNVWLYETTKPDIIFEASDGKKVAIEVETGNAYVKQRKQLLEKVKRNNRLFGKKNWFFVVTHKEDFWNYKKLADTVRRSEVIARINCYFDSTSPMEQNIEPEMVYY